MTLHFLKKYDLIRYPVVTEKTTEVLSQNKYIFVVSQDSTKPLIKKAIEDLFEVKVKSVNMLIRKGKKKVFKGKIGQQSDTKRAIVTLCEGCQINLTDIKV